MQETISLYLDLKEGEKADFEVVGRSAAAFAELVREVAFILDPSVEVKLEFVSGTEGSTSLNAILRTISGKKKLGSDGDDDQNNTVLLIAIIIVVGGWFTSDLRTYGFNKLMDAYIGTEQRASLSDEDVARITNGLRGVVEGRIARDRVEQVFSELQRDDAIVSVGTVRTPGTKPTNPIPRSEFSSRAGESSVVQTETGERKKKTSERLTLISPVLTESQRFWRFRSASGEYGYAMRDDKFLREVLSGKRKIPMKEGIEISATVETTEVRENNLWVIRERQIIKVETVHRLREPADLFAKAKPAPKKKASGKKKKR